MKRILSLSNFQKGLEFQRLKVERAMNQRKGCVVLKQAISLINRAWLKKECHGQLERECSVARTIFIHSQDQISRFLTSVKETPFRSL